MSFRENLLHLRAVHGLTQEQLAEQVGVSRQSVAKWESDKSYPEMDKLIYLCQIFDCSLDDLVQGDLTDSEPAVKGPDIAHEAPPLEPGEAARAADAAGNEGAGTAPEPIDEAGYDAHMRTFAERISTGVMVVILFTAISTVFFTAGDQGGALFLLPFIVLPESVWAALGTLFVLAGVVLAVACIVPPSLEHAAFVRAHPHLEDFYTEEERTRARNAFAYGLVGGIVLIFAGVTVMIALADTPFEETVGLPIMLALIAFGVKPIVNNSMVFGMMNIASYNEAAAEILSEGEIERMEASDEQRAEYQQRHVTEKRIGGICGAIMMVATIAGLVMLFVPQYQTPLFWLAWPIGGLLCGLVATLTKAFARE